MATFPEIFDRCWVSVRGKIVAMQTSVELQAVDSDEQVDLLEFGGEFPPTGNIQGGRRLIVSWEMVVPVESPDDLALWDDYHTGDRVPIAVQLAANGRKISTKGVIREPRIRSNVNGTTTYSVSAMCDFAKWQ